jgi:hypothetical protein
MCLVMYSMVTGSSTVSRWLWHSIRALSIKIRASAVRPSQDGGTLSQPQCEREAETTTLTGKGEADMVVEHCDLAHRPGVLKLKDRLFLHPEHDDILAPYADLAHSRKPTRSHA